MLHPSKQIREECGNISTMTEYRWWQRGFPRPIKINGRNYYTSKQREIIIPKWIEAEAARNE